MAERRMFAKSIVLSDAFLDMPMSARCLYFTLGMFADDDGFIGSCKAIMRQCGASNDDMNILLAKRYVLDCGEGIIVIKHWRMNNYLQKDRYKETTYLEEKSQYVIDERGAYTEKNKCIQDVYTGKDSIGKDSIGKNNIGNQNPTLEEISIYCKERNNNVDPKRFYDYYQASGWKDSKGNPVKNWKQKMIAVWETKNSDKPEDKLPTYDTSKNVAMPEDEAKELLELMGKGESK